MRFQLHTDVKQSIQKVADGFNEKLFVALAPPFPKINLLRFDGSKKGDLVIMELHMGTKKQRWVSEIVAHGENSEEWFFIDEGRELPKPLKFWQHRHHLLHLRSELTRIVDDVTYSTGNKILDMAIYPALLAQFLYRKPIYQKFFR